MSGHNELRKDCSVLNSPVLGDDDDEDGGK